jgi:threonine/homoserine/homoserine lactone efflux protein
MFPLVFSPGPANIVFAMSGIRQGVRGSIPLIIGVDLVFIIYSLLIGFSFVILNISTHFIWVTAGNHISRWTDNKRIEKMLNYFFSDASSTTLSKCIKIQWRKGIAYINHDRHGRMGAGFPTTYAITYNVLCFC